jgi:hypothetical protein
MLIIRSVLVQIVREYGINSRENETVSIPHYAYLYSVFFASDDNQHQSFDKQEIRKYEK